MKSLILKFFLLSLVFSLTQTADTNLQLISDMMNHVQKHDFSFKEDILNDINHISDILKRNKMKQIRNKARCVWKICSQPLKKVNIEKLKDDEQKDYEIQNYKYFGRLFG